MVNFINRDGDRVDQILTLDFAPPLHLKFPVPDDFYLVDLSGIYLVTSLGDDGIHGGQTVRKRMCSYASVLSASINANGFLSYKILYAPCHKGRLIGNELKEITYDLDQRYIDDTFLQSMSTAQERIIHDLCGRGFIIEDVSGTFLDWIHHYLFVAPAKSKLQQPISIRTQEYTEDEGQPVTLRTLGG